MCPVPNISPDAQSSVFGGRMLYSPTPYWTWTASVDEVLGVSTLLSTEHSAGRSH